MRPKHLFKPMDHFSYYSRRAPVYDQVYLKPERQADLRLLEKKLSALLAGRSVLEIACGTGYWTEKISPAASCLHAIDYSPEMLAEAKKRTYPQGKVSFAEGDMYEMGEIQEKLDALFAGFIWSHVPLERLEAFLRGLHSQLLPGARLVFVDNCYVPGSSTAIAAHDEKGNSYQERQLPDGSIHRVLKNFPDEAQLQQVTLWGGIHLQVIWLEYYWVLVYELSE